MPPKPLEHVQRLLLHVNPVNDPKTDPPSMEVESMGMETCFRGSPVKAPIPTPVEAVFARKITETREVQSWKALFPMEVTEEGMLTEAREVQPENAPCPMEVTEEGRLTEVTLQPPKFRVPPDMTGS